MYTDFVRVGEHRINLAQVTEVDEGKLLLAYVDGDEEEIARLDSLLNAPKADWQAPDEPSGTIQTDEEIASADRDEIPW